MTIHKIFCDFDRALIASLIGCTHQNGDNQRMSQQLARQMRIHMQNANRKTLVERNDCVHNTIAGNQQAFVHREQATVLERTECRSFKSVFRQHQLWW